MLIYCCRHANLLSLAAPAPSPIPPLSAMRWSSHIPWFNIPLTTDSSLFGTALETQYVSLTSMPAICALLFWVEQYTWRLYEMESPGCRVFINASPLPQSCRTDISCSFSDKIRGIRGVIDGLCADDPLCKSGCFVGESLGHPVELTHLWCHIVIWYDGGLIGHDRQEHISTYFAQQLKNIHPLMSTLSVWQGDTIGGPAPTWLAPWHQISASNHVHEPGSGAWRP